MAKLSITELKKKLFQTDNLYELLLQRKSLLEELIAQKKNSIEWALKGSIYIATNSKKPGRKQYYLREKSTDKHGKYLKKGNDRLIKSLIQNEYDKKVLLKTEEELNFINRLLAHLDRNNLQTVYDEMLENKKGWINPVIDTRDAFVREWFDKNKVVNIRDAEHTNETNNHEWTRSKSEAFIANALLAAGVPYVYEYPLFDGNYVWAYPDFKVLNVRTRQEFFWEHLGRMDEYQYVDRNLKKLNKYGKFGYVQGKNLLLTFETRAKPISAEEINLIIQNFLL